MENIVYSECYGPEYRGISQIVKWFVEWNKRGKVLEWNIDLNKAAVKWLKYQLTAALSFAIL